MTPGTERFEDKREAIHDGAARLVNEYGYQGASVLYAMPLFSGLLADGVAPRDATPARVDATAAR